MKKILKRENIVLFIWPVIMWIVITFFMTDYNSTIGRYFFTHPLEFIFLFFLLNLFGCFIFHEAVTKTSLEDELKETGKKYE